MSDVLNFKTRGGTASTNNEDGAHAMIREFCRGAMPGRAWVAFLVGFWSLGSATFGQCSPHWLAGQDAAEWGLDGAVYAATMWDPDGPGGIEPALVVAGDFTTAGQTSVPNVAMWNGFEWTPLGTGFDGPLAALAVYDGELTVGGYFTNAGGTPANNIAAWNGAAWRPLGAGTSSIVLALSEFSGELIAGGDFTMAGGQPARKIARWNGASWQPLGAGTNFGVASLGNYNGRLIVGGYFTAAGGSPANYIASWDGSVWRPLGSGTNDWVLAMCVFNNQLVVGGAFTYSGGGIVNRVARWNGLSWSGLGNGLDGTVYAITMYNGSLIAAGAFFGTAPPQSSPMSAVARWNGTSWSAMGSGLDDAAYALTVDHSELIVGGIFTNAGGVQSLNWARWSDTGIPWVARQPLAEPQVCENGLLALETVGAGTPPFSYQWQLNVAPDVWVNMADGTLPWSGGTIIASGTAASTLTLEVNAPVGSTPPRFRCSVGNACGASLSSESSLLITACVPCPADFNNDGGIDGGDVSAFFAAWESAALQADVNADGGVDGLDVGAFFADWETGAC